MATSAIEQTADTATEAPKGKRGLLILAAAGILAGAGAGLFVVGPVLAKHRAASPAAPKKDADVTSTAVVHPIENLVLNPAGSNGTRFLMVTVTFEVKDAGADQAMKDREAEVRDVILALLSKKTVEELTDTNVRESLKKDVFDAISPLFPKGTIEKVFFPQFVIQ